MYWVRKATIHDWEDLVALRLAISARLREDGVEHWQDNVKGLMQLLRWLEHDCVYMVFDGDILAGSFSLTELCDDRYWGDDPDRGSFMYLHKVMAAPEFKGKGVGSFIVSDSSDWSRIRGRQGLRIECVNNNPRLREVWEGLGFTHIRTVEVPGTIVGTLMERRNT